MGSDEPEASDDGRPSENVFADNVISNTPTGVKLKEGDNNVFTGKPPPPPHSLLFGVNAFTTGTPFFFTNLLQVSVGRGFGAQ